MWDLIVSVPYHCLSFYFVNYDYTSPKKILEEELLINCVVCDKRLDGDAVNCIQCDNECHLRCTDMSDDGK